MNRFIGREGEDIFKTLCNRSGVTCNNSDQDDYGWDFHLEFPPAAVPDVAIDMRPGPLSALVQVKTTRSSKFSWHIKLSNALRLVNSELPCFLVLVRLGKKETRQIYVVHIWKDLIGSFLKAGREADSQHCHAPHKKVVLVRFPADGEQSQDPVGWMRSQIESVGSDYAGVKLKLRKSVGFEEGYGVGNVTFDMQSIDELIDWHLGLKESVKFSRLEVTSRRFGILAGKPDICKGPGRMFVEPAKKSGTLRLRLASGDLLYIPAEVLLGALPGLPASQIRWRVRAGCLDIVLNGNCQASAKATIEINEKLPLDRITECAALQMPASNPVELEIAIAQERIDLGRLEFNETHEAANWTHIFYAVRTLQEICRVAAQSGVLLTMADVLHAVGDLDLQQRAVLSPLVLLSVFASDWPMRLELQPSEDTPASFNRLLAYSLADVGEHRFGGLVERQIPEDVSIDGRRHIKFGPTRVIEAFVGTAGSSSVETKLDIAYEKRLNQQSGDTVLAVRDFQRFIMKANSKQELVADRPREHRR